ncbi:MAG: type IX secretion system membrane protein PorP/SprF [Mucilaginibacter sp.]
MKRILTLLTFMLSTGLLYAQQDAQQSQYMFNGLYINPAYAGYKETLNIHSFYRTQWTGIQGAPRTMALALDASANNGNVGLAFQLANDKLGAQSNLSAYASYAYRIRMNDDGSSRLALGVSIGVMQLGISGVLLDPNDVEANQPIGVQNAIVPDGRTGIYFSSNRFYVGASADNLIAQYINVKDHAYILQPKPHFYFTTGMLLPITTDVLIKPSILIKDDRAGPTSMDLNAFILLGQKLWLGGSYRSAIKLYDKGNLQNNLNSQNSVVAVAEIFAMPNLRIGYAYDFSVGPLQGYSGGTHEISIGYYFKRNRSRMLTPRYF